MDRSMYITFTLILYFLSFTTETANAQRTEKDSIWLQDVLNGKRQLKLNPEIQKQIESGTFINFDNKKPIHLKPSVETMISKDFSEIIQLNEIIDDTTTCTTCSKVRLYNSPVYLKYNGLPSFHISPRERQRLRNSLPGAATFDAENMLRYLFWKEHRAKMRNKKKANAWKHYNLD